MSTDAIFFFALFGGFALLVYILPRPGTDAAEKVNAVFGFVQATSWVLILLGIIAGAVGILAVALLGRFLDFNPPVWTIFPLGMAVIVIAFTAIALMKRITAKKDSS